MKLQPESDSRLYDDDITEEMLDLHRKAISFRERFKTIGVSQSLKSRKTGLPKTIPKNDDYVLEQETIPKKPKALQNITYSYTGQSIQIKPIKVEALPKQFLGIN